MTFFFCVSNLFYAEKAFKRKRGGNKKAKMADELMYSGNLGESQVRRIRLLWKIFVETDLNDIEELEREIYEYGSYLEEKDLLGRRIFLRMVCILQMAKSCI